MSFPLCGFTEGLLLLRRILPKDKEQLKFSIPQNVETFSQLSGRVRCRSGSFKEFPGLFSVLGVLAG